MQSSEETAGDRLASNPFFVLGLAASASATEIEREGQKLIGMLELGLPAAATYPTPLGKRARTVDLVRSAMAELRDPQRRLRHELWLPEGELSGSAPDPLAASATPWRGARAAFGWER